MTPARLLVFLLVIAGLASCGPVPRPFQHEAGRHNALLTLEDATGIVVLPPETDLVTDPAAWTSAMVEALKARDIPASARQANAGSRFLYSHFSEQAQGSSGLAVSIVWDLYSAEGTLSGSYRQNTGLSAEIFRSSPDIAIKRSIEPAAERLVVMMGTAPRRTRPIPGYPEAAIHVAPFGDTPGDSAISLRNAIVAELTDSQLPVTGRAGRGDLILQCEIALEEPQGELQKAAITWRLLAVDSGEELGMIDQSNFVPAGSLDGFWGPTALDVARGAREGVLDLLKRLGTARKLPAESG